ncbi:hypothetical protein AK973_4201 [Pseudomonas brassicacearum]|nr:hypothetical protein AK973_4201 [Pseudomonas brassicacearum]
MIHTQHPVGAYLWEQGLPAMQATWFNCKTVSSFIASKLCSHRLAPTKEICGL